MIDSHCHLAGEEFAADLEAVVARARDAGVSRVLCILSADEPDELNRAEEVRRAWPDVCFAVGIHPHRSGAFAGRADAAVAIVREAAARFDAVAIGEIGLDYHYDFSPREAQRDVFRRQAALAESLGLPVVIHTREAANDTASVLDEFAPRLRGVMHCFSGTAAEAASAIARGFLLSFSGILTFPKAEVLRTIAAGVPADRLLVETDAPFLAPVPHRGKRNEPAWVGETLRTLARVRHGTAEDLGAIVAANFARFIGRYEPSDAR